MASHHAIEDDERAKSNSRDELRTIAFRLRELQRLMSMRVMQENARLEAEGIPPVTEAGFVKEHDDRYHVSNERVHDTVERLASLDLGETARMTLLDGRTVSGEVGPIDYVPTERLRVDVRPTDDSTVRYEVKTRKEGADWTPVTVRRYSQDDDDWVSVGILRTVTSP